MRSLLVGFLLVIPGLLTGCARLTGRTLSDPPVQIAQAETIPTATLISPEPTFTPTAAVATSTPSPVSEGTTESLSFELCSPLGMHPLEELPQIISDPYKPPPQNRPEERHHGVDFSYWHYETRDSMLGEPVQAILAGTVASVIEDLYPYGNMIIIETRRIELPSLLVSQLKIAPNESLYLLYAHLNSVPRANLGDQVAACQPLGEVGMSGNTDIPHLHVETRLGPAGSVFESMRFYDTRASVEEMETYLLWRTSGEYRHFDPMIILDN
jgi:murein DD-endopeptidase MepM/ murein hydrolase activator NlpD